MRHLERMSRCPLLVEFLAFAPEENPRIKGTLRSYYSISDAVMPGLMTAVHGLDKNKGVDLIVLSHGRHITIQQAQELGLNIEPLEASPELQDAVLSAHHCYIVTFSMTPAVFIIENQIGKRFVNVQFPAPPGVPFMIQPQPAP